MVALTALPTGGIIYDTDRRDTITLGDGIDRVKLARDGKTDTVLNFEDGVDKINLTEFNVNWSEVQVKYKGDGEFVITIRGESTKITFKTPTDGSVITEGSLGLDDFSTPQAHQTPSTTSSSTTPASPFCMALTSPIFSSCSAITIAT